MGQGDVLDVVAVSTGQGAVVNFQGQGQGAKGEITPDLITSALVYAHV